MSRSTTLEMNLRDQHHNEMHAVLQYSGRLRDREEVTESGSQGQGLHTAAPLCLGCSSRWHSVASRGNRVMTRLPTACAVSCKDSHGIVVEQTIAV